MVLSLSTPSADIFDANASAESSICGNAVAWSENSSISKKIAPGIWLASKLERGVTERAEPGGASVASSTRVSRSFRWSESQEAETRGFMKVSLPPFHATCLIERHVDAKKSCLGSS